MGLEYHLEYFRETNKEATFSWIMSRISLLWLLRPFGSSMDIDQSAGKLPADGKLGGAARSAPAQAVTLPPCLENLYTCHSAQAEW